MKKRLKVPKFKHEAAERDYWQNVNLAAHFSPSDFTSATFPNLKPTSRAISLRVPEYLLLRLKERANELHVPYQSLIKRYIADGVADQHS